MPRATKGPFRFAFDPLLLATVTGACLLLEPGHALGSDLIDVRPLTERTIMLHFDDGHVVYHERGKPRSAETVVVSPLDTKAASQAASYTVTSGDDAAFKTGKRPIKVGRKSKGTEFSWLCEWDQKNNRCSNAKPDHAAEHWVYVTLPRPMKAGKTYEIATGSLAANGKSFKVVFDSHTSRSEAVHVNLLGYVPSAPSKFAYVYHWMGDRGGFKVKGYAGRGCHLVNEKTGKRVFSGKLAPRKEASNPETGHASDTPDANFLGADVFECDFSSFSTPGRYRVSVEGIGCSFPFSIDADVYREAFRTVARGLYHNRSGIALEQPYTEFTRPAPHNPKLTPGFAGKLLYTTLRFTEWGSEGGDAKALLAASKGPIESAGWYQDAGDWDSYYSHLRVAQELLLAYHLAPKNFSDGELNIPESGNGLPDILDEAAWLPRFLYRLRHELLKKRYGSGGVGLRVAGDDFGSDEKVLPDGTKVGQGSWEDVERTWVASGEDPWSTYRYAGVAAHLAFLLQRAGLKDPEKVDWAKEGKEAYAWAQKNTRKGDEKHKEAKLSTVRLYAAAALFQLTGDRRYEKQLIADAQEIKANTQLGDDDRYGPMIYALFAAAQSKTTRPDSETAERLRQALLFTANETVLSVSEKRALRWGGNWWMPMLVGQQTTPWILEGAVAYALTKKNEPERAQRYLAALYTTGDYFLGTNSLNTTWVTGLGPRHPNHPFHMDAWYNGKGKPHPGIIPYGPWRKEADQGPGPWDKDWPNKTLHPKVDLWPGNERWYDNRASPLTNEFTVHQNTGPAAAYFGLLAAPGLAAQE